MAKAKRLLLEHIKLVDVLIELVDARIPASSRNPVLAELAVGKPRLVALNKSDLADPGCTRQWEEYYRSLGFASIAIDSVRGSGFKKIPMLVSRLAGEKTISLGSAGRRPRPPRCMIVGIPNVGKSFFINRLAGQKAARTGNKPGVTKGRQWIRTGGIELLDTPGILWPKFEDPDVGYKLAVTGAIKEEVFNIEEVALKLLVWLGKEHPRLLCSRYRMDGELPADPAVLLELLGNRRGFFKSGMIVDTYKSAVNLLKEFREGRLGRFTLDLPGK
jgi:ribosome biogenesis GTPase A